MADFATIDYSINAFLTQNLNTDSENLIEYYDIQYIRAKQHINALKKIQEFGGNAFVTAGLLSPPEVKVVKVALNYLLEDASDIIRMVALINSSELLDLEKQCAEVYPTHGGMVPFNRYKLMMSINTIFKEADYRYGLKLNWWDMIIKRASKQHFTELFLQTTELPLAPEEKLINTKPL